jgi:hypothetical protein
MEPTDPLRINDERKHLEGLLKDRINFFLVFAPVVLGAAYNIKDEDIRAWLLLFATGVSLLISLAVLRTHLLVQQALKEVLSDPSHPFTRYRNAVPFPPNANLFLVPIPFLVTLALGVLTASAFWSIQANCVLF